MKHSPLRRAFHIRNFWFLSEIRALSCLPCGSLFYTVTTGSHSLPRCSTTFFLPLGFDVKLHCLHTRKLGTCAGVSHPHHSGDATFVLMLHVNEDAFDDIERRSEV